MFRRKTAKPCEKKHFSSIFLFDRQGLPPDNVLSFVTVCQAWVSQLPGFPLAAQNENYRLFWMLGLALTLPMILLSGPLAGYLISMILVNKMGLPGFLTPALMALGLVGSGLQTYRLIKKLNTKE
jgi:hypothetical protein